MEDSAAIELPAVFDDLDVGITLHDAKTGAVLDINDRLEHLYGYSSAEIRSMRVEEYTARSAKFTQQEAVRRIRAAAGGDSQQFEWQIRRSNGEVRWVRVHLNASTLDGKPCVLAEVHDITEQRSRERRLRLFSRIIRHNLRNSANGLIGYAQLIEQALEDDTLEEKADTLISLAKDVGGLSDSVTQLEEIISLDSDDRSPTNLGEFVPSLVERFQTEYSDLSITISSVADTWVMGHRGLEYAIQHALENAAEHNSNDDALLDIAIEEREKTAHIKISDNGPLIPEQEIEVLNESVQASSTYHGSGAGLWVLKWAVDSLGGDLRFSESSYGGNTVTIILPKIEAP